MSRRSSHPLVRALTKEIFMKIRERKLLRAITEFFGCVKSRLAEKEAAGYKGWDGSYPRQKLIAEIRRDLVLVESGQALPKHTFDVAARIFMIWVNSSPADFIR
jgi:hypothetical protein